VRAVPHHGRAFGSSPLSGLGPLLAFPGLAQEPAIKPEDLAGKAVLLVNTASYCGYTPQLKGLEALQRQFGPKGLIVLAIPSNDFGAQEPDEEPAVLKFYRGAPYNTTFPITSKQKVIGGDAHPAYGWLSSTLGPDAGPDWNFAKFLVGRDGNLVGLFAPAVEPTSNEVKQAIESALAE
jgi:glutathione peroxidase